MATPTVSGSVNKPAGYAPGEIITLTVTYSDADKQNGTITLTVTDSAGNTSAPVTVPFVIDPTTIAVSSVPSRVWTKVSDNGSVAVYTATA